MSRIASPSYTMLMFLALPMWKKNTDISHEVGEPFEKRETGLFTRCSIREVHHHRTHDFT
jgi:hypothetical protein